MLITVFEAAMILLFGISWPFNVIKSWRVRSAKGKSLQFLLLIFIGYICGIVSKLISVFYGDFFNNWLQYMLFCFYCLNLVMVAADICLYFRNKALDRVVNDKI